MATQVFSQKQRFVLVLFLGAAIIALAAGMILSGAAQADAYDAQLDKGWQGFESGKVSQSHVLFFSSSMSVARDLVLLRYVAMFMAVLIILLGAILVVGGLEATYQLDSELASVKTALQTSSPGLVLITLGTLVFMGALYRTTEVSSSYNERARPKQAASALPARPERLEPARRANEQEIDPPAIASDAGPGGAGAGEGGEGGAR